MLNEVVLTRAEYKKLLGKRLQGLTEEEIELWYQSHTIITQKILELWRKRWNDQEPSDF